MGRSKRIDASPQPNVDDSGAKQRRAKGQGSVYQNKKGEWFVTIPLGNGKTHTARVGSQTEGEAKRQELLKDRDEKRSRNVDFAAGRQTIQQFLSAWLTTRQADIKLTTLRFYKGICENQILPGIGHIRLEELRPEDVMELLNDLRADPDISPRTVHHAYVVLGNALNLACQWRYVTYNVARAVPAPKVPHTDTMNDDGSHLVALKAAQLHMLLDDVEGHRLATLYHMAVTFGMRKGELLGCRWVDVDWDRATVRVTQQVQDIAGHAHIDTPKTRTSRRVLPIPPRLLERLRAHQTWQETEREIQTRNEQWQEHGLIFPSEVGTPMIPRNLSHHFDRVRERTGLKGIRFHDLRHTVASQLANMGISEIIIGAILGHSNARVTSRYIHVDISPMRNALVRLEEEVLCHQNKIGEEQP